MISMAYNERRKRSGNDMTRSLSDKIYYIFHYKIFEYGASMEYDRVIRKGFFPSDDIETLYFIIDKMVWECI